MIDGRFGLFIGVQVIYRANQPPTDQLSNPHWTVRCSSSLSLSLGVTTSLSVKNWIFHLIILAVRFKSSHGWILRKLTGLILFGTLRGDWNWNVRSVSHSSPNSLTLPMNHRFFGVAVTLCLSFSLSHIKYTVCSTVQYIVLHVYTSLVSLNK